MNLGFDPKNIGRKIEKIPQLYKAIIMLVLVFLLICGLVYFIAVPRWEEEEKLIKKNDEIKKELNILMEIERNIDKHRKENAELQETLLNVMKELPESKDIPNLLRNITTVSEENRLKIKYFEPKQIKSKDFYTELPFEIKFSGTFHNVAYFFDGIRKMERLVNVTDFTLESKGSPSNVTIEGTCSANAYVYIKESAKNLKKDDKKKEKGDQDAKK